MTNAKKKPDCKILVVEDDQILREAVIGILNRCGFKTLEASGGTQALAIVKEKQIDLVLSDVCMPDGDGNFLLNEVRKIYPVDPLFIFLTGFAEKSTKEAIKRGAFMVLSKPCSRTVLLGAIDQALGLNRVAPKAS
jgi:CheY-like chemotaxis protein